MRPSYSTLAEERQRSRHARHRGLARLLALACTGVTALAFAQQPASNTHAPPGTATATVHEGSEKPTKDNHGTHRSGKPAHRNAVGDSGGAVGLQNGLNGTGLGHDNPAR